MLFKENTYFCTIILMILGLYFLVKKKTDTWVYLFFVLSFLSGIYLTLRPEFAYHYIGKENCVNLSNIVKECMITTLIPLVFIFCLPGRYLIKVLDFFCQLGFF